MATGVNVATVGKREWTEFRERFGKIHKEMLPVYIRRLFVKDVTQQCFYLDVDRSDTFPFSSAHSEDKYIEQ